MMNIKKNSKIKKIKSYVKLNVCLLLLMQSIFLSNAVSASKPDNSQWVLTGRTGFAWLMNEITPDFKFLSNEFRHQPGLVLDFSVGRTLGNNWEPGINFNVYRLSGESSIPDFSANGLHHSFMNLYQLPVEYVTVSTSLSAYCRYYFIGSSQKSRLTIQFQPYVEIGGGVNYFFTELGYKIPPEGSASHLIFNKGTQDSGSGPGNVAQFITGLGTKAVLPGNLSLIVSLNADLVNYDCMDAVHNYTNGKRNHAFSIVPKFLIGVYVPLSNKNISNRHMPWSP
jgi:hypothetical protein